MPLSVLPLGHKEDLNVFEKPANPAPILKEEGLSEYLDRLCAVGSCPSFEEGSGSYEQDAAEYEANLNVWAEYDSAMNLHRHGIGAHGRIWTKGGNN